jgi:hypothetical protein
MRGVNLAAMALGGLGIRGILFDIRAWNFFGSKTVSSKLVSDLDLNRVCSKASSNSRSSILCARLQVRTGFYPGNKMGPALSL